MAPGAAGWPGSPSPARGSQVGQRFLPWGLSSPKTGIVIARRIAGTSAVSSGAAGARGAPPAPSRKGMTMPGLDARAARGSAGPPIAITTRPGSAGSSSRSNPLQTSVHVDRAVSIHSVSQVSARSEAPLHRSTVAAGWIPGRLVTRRGCSGWRFSRTIRSFVRSSSRC